MKVRRRREGGTGLGEMEREGNRGSVEYGWLARLGLDSGIN